MLFRICLGLFILLFTTMSGLALFQYQQWPWILLEQFKFYFAFAQLILFLLILALISSAKRFTTVTILLCLLTLSISLYTLQDFFPYIPFSRSTNTDDGIKLLHLNVLGTNHQIESAAKIIKNARADIITLVEYNEYWQAGLKKAGAFDNYPYSYTVRFGNDGIYSKLPLSKCKTAWFSQRQNRVTSCDVKTRNTTATLVLVHPKPPVKEQWHQRQLELFDYLRQNRKAYHPHLILVGDLNTVPWSSSIKKLSRELNVSDSRVRFGLYPTWHSDKWPITLPIDYVLLSAGFKTLKIETGQNFGSDHIPLVVLLKDR